MKAIVLAEFLYRFYGRMLHDYAPLISGYTRALEIELRQYLLPKIRDWILRYGNANDAGRRWIRLGDQGQKLHADVQERYVTLGTWPILFCESDPRRLKHTPGEFYHCVHREYGATIDFSHLARFGELLAEATKLRNEAAHGSVNDWDKVRRARRIVLEEDPLSLLISNVGSLLL